MITRRRIKMCGTTNLTDAHMAVGAGVDALGFIFAEQSKRYISPDHAAAIIKEIPPFVSKVGVFVNGQMDEIVKIAHMTGLTAIQLHGHEQPEFCRQLALGLPSLTIIKGFRVGSHSVASEIFPFHEVVNGYLLDTYIEKEAGGTGIVFDWQIIKKLNLRKPYILAGGLNPGNIVEALDVASPYAVDVNSGVESAPGKKDHNLVMRFIEKVVECDRMGKTINEQ